MTKIVGEIAPASMRTELAKLLERAKFAEVADQCRRLLGTAGFYRLVRSLLGSPVEPPEATHRPIVATRWRCIVTTNFDALLEDAYARWSDHGVPRTPTGTELMHHGTLLLDGGFFILKAHGTLEDVSSMVFTSEDYRRIIHASPAFNQMLAAILLGNSVLFVGYSLSDPNFRLLLDAQLSTFGAEVPRRYAVMESAGQAEEELLWRMARVRVISYPKGRHEFVGRFLASLAQSAQPSAAAVPTPRARTRSRATVRPLTTQRVLRVELTARYSNLDAAWSRIEMRGYRPSDLSSAPLVVHGSGVLPPWSDVRSALKQWAWSTVPFDHEKSTHRTARRLGQLLAHALPPDLRQELASDRHKDVITLVLSPALQSLPWEWMAINGAPLFLKRVVVRQPGDVSSAARGRPFVHTPPRVLLIGDSGSAQLGLPASRREVKTLRNLVVRMLPNATVTLLVGRAASHARVLEEIEHGGYDVVHFSGHVGVTDQSEAFLLLNDGNVSGSDLITLLARRPPPIFFVNGGGAISLPFVKTSRKKTYDRLQSTAEVLEAETSEAGGLAWVAARAGVGTFVGGFGLLTDENSSRFAVGFYRRLFAGFPAAEAFAGARHEMQATTAEAYCYVMSGYPDVALSNRE